MPLVTSRRFLLHVLLFSLALLLLLRAHPARGEAAGKRPAHYIVFEIGDDGVVRPMAHRLVSLDLSRTPKGERAIEALLAAPPGNADVFLAELADAAGAVVFRDAIVVPRFLRSEFEPGLDGGLHVAVNGTLVEIPNRSFVVRVPAGHGVRLTVRPAASSPGASARLRDAAFDLGALASGADLPLQDFSPPSVVRASPQAANSGNRVDMLLMGDGYQMSEQSKFNTDTTNVLASFFALTPYSQYANFVNTSTLFTASTQSGADHPPYMAGCPNPPVCCSDTDAQTDPLAGTYVNTAFDGTFCTSNIHRLLTVNFSKINTAAAAVPERDEILVLVNDTTYGGAGGAFSTFSMHPQAVNVAQHEYGHTFSRLADEYTSAYPGFPPCSDVTSPACEANVTDQTVRASIKWTSWIAMATPIPTSPADTTDVGLFQGARYLTMGMYRPKSNCLMRALGVPFCEICRQTYVLRLYNGGWGVPASGIDNVEPGSESPAPGMLNRSFPGSQTFTVSLLAPIGGPALTVSWWVDGVVVPAAMSNSYTYTFTSTGTHTVELRTHDGTTFVNAAMAGTALDSSRLWTLNITCATDVQAPTVTPPAAAGVPQTLCQ